MLKFSSEILLALAYVSQIKDPNSVRSRFIESLNALDDAFAFKFVDLLPPGLPENRVLPIATLRSSFGFAVIAEGTKITETDRAVFRNAFQFLAVLLENRLQASALASKNESLLKEINQEKSFVRTILDTLPVGVWVADGEGTILMGNAAGEKIWAGIRYIGIDQYSEYKGRWSDTGERIESEEWALARAIKMGETSINEEIDIECFDGTHKTILNSAAPLLDNERRIIGAVGINQDVTERRQAEIMMRESEERFRAIFQRSTVGKSLTLPDGKLLQINKAFADSLGYSIEELVQLNFAQITHLDDVAESRECIRILLADEQTTYRMEKRYIHKNGDIVWADVSTTLLRDEQGTPLYFITSIVDITGRKQMEEEKRNLEERLQRAEKMEALGLLAGGVAHDLNNVLGIVVGYAEMLLMVTDKSNPIKSKLVNIMEAGQKAATIVGDLLTLARRGVSGRDVVNLNKIIADLQQSPEFEKLSSYNSAVKFKTNLDPDLLNISGSSVHLNKTLFNLVSNAREAMKKGGCVTIKTANRYLDKPIHGYDKIQEGDYVVLSVSDTGEGIHEADMKRIFEPFYTKKVMGRSGTGLGLAVVWGTVKDHNGYINVQSEEGKGSIFTLYFPVTREELSAGHVAVSISEFMGKGESVLVIDDVKEQRNLAEEMLRKLNYSVTSASSGEEALAYLKDHKVDLLVLDMIMDSGMDGLDTYRHVLEIYPQQKAIIVSGFSESDRVKAAQSLGAGVYVRKPYVIEKLGLAVRKELDRSV